MKLSWLSTSEAHKHTSIYMIWQYESMHKIRESLEKVDQTQTQGYVSRFEHPVLRPRLHTEGFPLSRPHRTSTQGTSTEDYGKYNNREYTTPLSTNTTSHQRQCTTNTKSTSHKRGRHLTYKHNHLTLKGFQHKLHLSLEGAKHNFHLSLEGANHNFHNHLTIEGY